MRYVIMALAEKYNLLVVEDAAHCVDSFYKDKPLGGIGHLGAFSFHETKNISSGEGGMLVVNDDRFIRRAEILWWNLSPCRMERKYRWDLAAV